MPAIGKVTIEAVQARHDAGTWCPACCPGAIVSANWEFLAGDGKPLTHSLARGILGFASRLS